MNLIMKPLSGPAAVLKYLAVHWKSLIIIFVPLIFSPLIFIEGKPAIRGAIRWHCKGTEGVGRFQRWLGSVGSEGKCGFVICVMALYWMTESLPLPITSLMPVVLFPIFGILSTDEVCLVYLKETNVMFLGGVILAIAIEHCNLHKRIALRVMLIIGTSPQRLMLGFMMTTMFLSMWISNSAATSMMTPIVIAVMDELKSFEDDKSGKRRATLTESAGVITSLQDSGTFDGETRRESVTNIDTSQENKLSKTQISYFLGVAYAANIGGTGTITGTATNLTFKGIFESLFPDADGINFATWMVFNVPLMLFNTLLAWLWLQIFYMGLFRNGNVKKVPTEQQKQVRNLIRQSYDDLGPMTYHEISVLCLFVLDVLLWFFRKPEFIDGWSTLFPEKVVKDATSAIAIVILLFILPANLDFLNLDKASKKESPALLTWRVLHEKIPFGIILLLGGGFAISKACEVSGLSNYLGHQLEVLKQFPPAFILTITVLGTTFATEVSSNTAVANILLPMLAKMCRIIRLHPLYMMLPTTVTCSYAFMLPVATPPNAIVAAASNMKTSEMMKAGIGMNLICSISLVICFLFIGVPIYGLTDFPAWAENKNSTFIT